MARPRAAILVAILCNIALAIALALLAGPRYPVAAGSPAGFWMSTTGVFPGAPETGFGPGIFDGEYAYYSPPSMDSQWILRVRAADALAEFPRVVAGFETLTARDPRSLECMAYLRWKALPPAERTPERLVDLVQAVFHGMPAKRLWLAAQTAKAHRYWLLIAFEFVFLSGLIWFICLPLARFRAHLHRSVHLVLFPSVLLLPAWLGYCSAICPGVGYAGGIIYPFISESLAQFPSIAPKTNRRFFLAIPDPLDALDIAPQWSDVEILLFGVHEAPGPVDTAAYGALLVACYWGIIGIRRSVRNARRAGGI